MEGYDYAFVGEIPLYTLIFDKVMKDNGYSHHLYCEKIMEKSNNHNVYKNICIFLFKGLNYIYNNNNNGTLQGDNKGLTKKKCQYLIYRLNQELRNIKEYPCNTSIFFHNLKSYISSLSSEYKICESEIEVLDNVVFNNIEILEKFYSYLYNYMYDSFGKSEQRCNYAEDFAKLYDQLLPHCYLHSNTFCNALIDFGRRYNQYLSNDNNCSGFKTCLYYPVTENNSSQITLVNECNKLLNVKTEMQPERPLSAMYDSSTVLGYKVFTGFSFILMALPVLFNFYKFTPIGEMLRYKFGNKRTKSYEAYGENYLVASNEPQNEQTNPRRIGYRIAYN
ncbi:PIR Superfamily Protein [Plasmodium ovale wallikeri]|uniref:PIR Superfamily Protein n=1 Tax=Plasmodium ovale wallikeri TaxID=864142 RepID=A0A1A9APP3_PLAOA|nr:PIR Superfamily Protein [Plasmodium ovale wallikeri]